MDLCLPIFHKIKNKVLILDNFQMSAAQINALIAASQFLQSFIEGIIFSFNGISD